MNWYLKVLFIWALVLLTIDTFVHPFILQALE